MQIPLQITFRDFPSSEAVETRIRDEAAKLERFQDSITGFRVVVEAPHKNRHKGNLFHTSIHITVPGSEIDVTREPPKHHAHEDIYVSIRDAFREATRQLEDLFRKRTDREHHGPPRGAL